MRIELRIRFNYHLNSIIRVRFMTKENHISAFVCHRQGKNVIAFLTITDGVMVIGNQVGWIGRICYMMGEE